MAEHDTAEGGVPESGVFKRRRTNRIIFLAVVAVLIVAASVVSVCIGQYQLAPGEIWPLLRQGPIHAQQPGNLDASVLWQIRLPRVVLGLLVGAALGVGGALMQAVFANPLAEPSVIGVTSGAGVGAALVIVAGSVTGAAGSAGAAALSTVSVPAAAFIAGLVATAVVYQLSRIGGRATVVTLILVGIALNAVCGAAISLLIFLAPTTAREQIVFWQMGTLAGATWEQTGIVATLTLLGIVGALTVASKLDILALGDAAAQHVGVNVGRLRMVAIALSTLLTAAAVSFAGLIGFIGLVVPHIVRTALGPSNKVLVPASALGGALLIGVADIFARTLIPFADMPIGIFTALIGGPTFFFLLRKMLRKRQQL
ncbi:FecCD family ABC transporter permease [Corynebacterium cystitidis]|uniref:Iron complex transport system permease protein n=1 Tax=Corynebacterium cystitidis DSM 20524 TaxID=1121357 RepID=A0A1H9UVX4_9CORY|nr:iron ABC transporter permease [Corynebacterium cystitidis]WJY83685.1 Hemin transport system permease protein HmuU [Corynebacterium cystitidis DSM 20524]SES13489.1 iron complex transport system permease protein [Corynebacterium cystitidis DSM 20524]SNV91320.1 iron ABC transporter permease [Corynebacterium cystitidis]